MTLPCKGSDPRQTPFYEIQKKSSSCFNFRAWSCSENEQRLWTTASLEKAAGWVGRVSAQSGVTGTKDRGLCFPRSSLSTPVLPRLPKCRSARAREEGSLARLKRFESAGRRRSPEVFSLPVMGTNPWIPAASPALPVLGSASAR